MYMLFNFKEIDQRFLGSGRTTYLVKAIQEYNKNNPDKEGYLICVDKKMCKIIEKEYNLKCKTLDFRNFLGLNKENSMILFDNFTITYIVSELGEEINRLSNENIELKIKLDNKKHALKE
jgi:hypothetical protein